MKLKENKIQDIESWFKYAPPMGGALQWQDGRSAKELARYMTAKFPDVPQEIENVLTNFTQSTAEFDWAGEYVTNFANYNLGHGEGRNHDAFMWNSDIVVGIEGKADEPLGSQFVGDALVNASENKIHRIRGMIDMLFGDVPENHKSIRYQLVTATTATLLEAKEKRTKNALFLVIVFKKRGYYSEQKIFENKTDIKNFLLDVSAKRAGDYFEIPTKYGNENNINLYFHYIEINLK